MCFIGEVRSADFDFVLPPELVAQQPTSERDASRLLVLHRAESRWEHQQFRELRHWLRAGDLLVFNDSRVIPARLRGVKTESGGAFEILLLEPTSPWEWWCLAKPGKSLRPGTTLAFQHPGAGPNDATSKLTAEVLRTNAQGHRHLRFAGVPNLAAAIHEWGELPLPPYIRRMKAGSGAADRERYQTIYARVEGSVAAPTAGLHFQTGTLAELKAHGVEEAFVTLHVGLGTFSPVKTESLADHVMHEERFELPAATAEAVNRAKKEGRRIIAVGTTSARVLESVARQQSPRAELQPVANGRTRLFLYPPTKFGVIDGLLTNFHLPQSTLLMLASAFAGPGALTGRELVLRAYADAIREHYRFFSYGDAMLIL